MKYMNATQLLRYIFPKFPLLYQFTLYNLCSTYVIHQTIQLTECYIIWLSVTTSIPVCFLSFYKRVVWAISLIVLKEIAPKYEHSLIIHDITLFYNRSYKFRCPVLLALVRRSAAHGHLSRSECSVPTSCLYNSFIFLVTTPSGRK
jgi:hypothetical protein